ncbi:outer membrane beta-barrel family protein [Segetibacter aerophilus]|uniref:TonB-dependent receptor n=1 Tax=Segetibacter aerophilus TaxID=670293 RepID=A0A512BGI9_9BACT|nr:outer membrane beta-barrel family protein [Segetibacter aerophilus]GEO11076.1 TonB-dependent receptor [Segetibacter aerophilus]
MKFYVLLSCIILFLSNVSAQNAGTVSGNVSNNNKAAEGATVALLKAKDSATIKLSVTSKEGLFSFENVANGKYLVSVTTVGHRKSFSRLFEITPSAPRVLLPTVNLIALPKALADVNVTTKRALVEQRIDRTIVNVDASITNVGTSALEVLEKSPGVSVDRDGNISLKGKAGVLVMVDGRPTQLGGADLANLLRTMNSNQLDQIEIMTNPPARYDAAGNAGIINIKTKKTVTAGYNGSASVAYSQGRYPKTTEGMNFNYREGKVNLFTNLSHNYQKRFSILSIDRNIFDSNTNSVENIFNQEANRISAGNSYNAKIGVDFFATKKTTLGAVVNVNSRGMSSNNPNITNISNAAKTLQSITRAEVGNETDWNSISTNVNFRTVLDKTGKEITSDIDFAKHTMDNNLFMVNSYTDATGNPYRKADTLTGLLPQQINVYSARVDYLHPLKKNARFEAGIKSSVVKTDNNANYDSIQYGRVSHDFNRSNHFVYEENIDAAYANFSTPLSKKITAQFGLRVENTNAKGRQRTTGEKFDRHYTQLFPTAYLQYKINDKNSFGANLGRRVSRPSYQSLNPFIKFIDRYTFSQGNPNLRPSISNNFELSHTWKNQITTTINYTNIKDVIEEVIQQKGQEAYNMPANVSSLNQFGIAVNANTPIAKWWTSSINLNVYNDNYKGAINGTSINRAATSFTVTGTQQFKVNKTLTAEVNGRFRNGWLEGIMRVRPVGFIGAGLSQQVLKTKGMLRLTARDIFWTQRLKGVTQYGNVDFEMRQVSETQVVTLGFSYSFSKGKKIAPVKRTAGSANEEQNRIGQ